MSRDFRISSIAGGVAFIWFATTLQVDLGLPPWLGCFLMIVSGLIVARAVMVAAERGIARIHKLLPTARGALTMSEDSKNSLTLLGVGALISALMCILIFVVPNVHLPPWLIPPAWFNVTLITAVAGLNIARIVVVSMRRWG